MHILLQAWELLAWGKLQRFSSDLR